MASSLFELNQKKKTKLNHFSNIFFLLWIVLIGAVGSAAAQNGVKKCRTTKYSLIYSPELIESITVLPDSIQQTLNNHLKETLGDGFYQKLQFDGGKLINYRQLVKQDPQVASYKWVAPKYDLRYFISDSLAGIGYCCSRIILDSVGGIINDIEFPSFSKNKSNAKFLPQNKLLNIARQLGFPTTNYELAIAKDHIVFIFSVKKNNKSMLYMEISVHTGEVIRKYKSAI